jgi:TetR/AcrR family transcriptional repressor of mexJK operon
MRPSKPRPSRLSPGRPKDPAKGEDIVRAATALFMKDGYELTSMDAVARRAGVSKLTIYSHFANKDELFKEVIRQRCDRRAMPECFMSKVDTSAEQGLMEIASRFLPLIYSPDSVRLNRIMQGEAARHPKVIQIFYDAGPNRVRAAFSELLEAWVKQKKLVIPDICKATEQFFSLLKGEMLLRHILLRTPHPSAEDMNEHVKATVALFLAAYAPPKQR